MGLEERGETWSRVGWVGGVITCLPIPRGGLTLMRGEKKRVGQGVSFIALKFPVR